VLLCRLNRDNHASFKRSLGVKSQIRR
jgi:hypothetical protein